MFNHKLKSFALSTFICLLIFVPFTLSVSAQSARNVGDVLDDLNQIAGKADINTEPTTADIVGQFINLFLAFIGVVFLIIAIYGGFTWMMARGNDEQITTAIKLIENGSVGIIIIALAYLLTNFVILKLINIIIISN